jgi:hypothetical protein
MNGYKTFAEFLEQRRAGSRRGAPDAREFAPPTESPTRYDLPDPEAVGGEGPVEERSSFRNPFRGVFKAVNPARPVLPTNSRLLASPFRKRRLKSQVIGK